MKKIIAVIMATVLTAVLLCACSPEAKKMKEAETVLSIGGWDSTSSAVFDTALTPETVSTRRFTKEQLPSGSVIRVAEGLSCTAVRWVNFSDAAEDSAVLIPAGEFTLTEEWWGDYTSCAFNLTADGCAEPLETAVRSGFTVLTDEKLPARREMTWNDDGVLAVLGVGNSFSDDALEYFWDIAKAAGVERVVVGNLYYAGCSVNQHYDFWSGNKPVYDYRLNENGKWVNRSQSSFEAAFGEFDWDYISFQQSAQARWSDANLLKPLAELMDMAHERCPGAKLVWHQPWANPHANYGNDKDKMFIDGIKAMRLIIEGYGFDEIIATCTAIENIRTSRVPNDDLLRDGWHLSSGIGRYVADLEFFTQLTGISVEGLSFVPAGVSAEWAQIAQEAAMNAAAYPRMITQSAYK